MRMANSSSSSSRLRREECRRTKHDSIFSNWKVLIGPSDWEDHSLGKDGAERYRTTNLPANCSCPGLYELGIALTSSNEGRKTRQTALSNIIVVYLGQADNVRTRLQQYGRAGSHLEYGNSFIYWKNSELPCHKRGPGLFKEIFSKNYSIVYRWAPMRDKKEAEKMEKKLLEFFDYAWNTSGNGTCRREDILSKLNKGISMSNSSLFSKFDLWKRRFGKKVGIKITPDLPPLHETESVNKGSFLPQVLKFVKSRPRLVHLDDELHNQDVDICGVAIGNGHICRNKPVSGRKRCSYHKGKRMTGIIPENESSITNNKLRNPSRSPNHEPESLLIKVTSDLLEECNACGVVLGDGSLCKNRPVPGRKRCELHKGKRISSPKSFTRNEDWFAKEGHRCNSLDEYDICGVASGDESVCRSRPMAGSKSFELHQGPRIVEHKLFCSKESWTPTAMHGLVSNLDALNICGVATIDGHVCWTKPVPGRKRCKVHKGMRITGHGLRISMVNSRGITAARTKKPT